MLTGNRKEDNRFIYVKEVGNLYTPRFTSDDHKVYFRVVRSLPILLIYCV